jgi:hypothetical protein
MIGGDQPLTHLFTDARRRGARIVPVTGLDRDPAYQEVVRQVHVDDLQGVALRCSLDEIADTDFGDKVSALLAVL